MKDCLIIVFGLIFKEDCFDLWNFCVIDVICELEFYGVIVVVYDLVVDFVEVKYEYGVNFVVWDDLF